MPVNVDKPASVDKTLSVGFDYVMNRELDQEEKTLAEVVEKMDNLRAALKKAGDILGLAEVDEWFRNHQVAIRRIRDKMEPDF